jgi:hypothetical protein
MVMEGSQAPSFGVDRALGLIMLVLVPGIVLVLVRESLISVSLARGAGGGAIRVKWLNTLLCQSQP